MAGLDATVVGIALPTVGRQFHTGLADLQWVVTAYTLTLAALLLVGGGLGDRYGRRKVFVIGTVWFALASLACAVAPSAPALIAARAFQGVGAALLTPGSLAILEASFAPDDRSKAIGAWSGLGGIATAVGPFLGGWLISAVSWRLIFFINLPLAVAVVAISARHVPDSRDPTATGRLDRAGAALVTGGLVGLVYGLIEGPALGWSAPSTLAALIGGAVLLAAFVVVEGREHSPMLPPALFASAQFSAANVVTFVVYGGLGGALFLLPIELQQVAGYSPLAAGAALLPVTALMLALSSRSGALASRIGPRAQMSVGPVVVAAGLALLARIGTGGNYLGDVLPAVAVFGFGLAVTVAPLTATVLAAAPGEHTGVASAVNNDVARTAGLIAVAVLPVLAGITGTSYLHAARFDHGFAIAVNIAAGACAIGGALAAITIRNPPQPPTTGLDREVHCALDAPPLRGRHHTTRGRL
ncbi:MAG: DHA2 family efflux MFS transporter permease subunit [Acidimicrobiales bacterium]